MSGRLLRILALTWTAGLIGVIQALRAPQLHRLASTSDAMAFALLMMLAIVSEMKPMPYSFGRESKANSLTITVVLCALFVFGWPVAVLVAAASVIVADIVSNKPYYKVLFNASVYVVATIAAAGAYEIAAGYLTSHPGLPPALTLLASGFAAGFCYYAVNVMLLMMVISEVQGGRLVRMIAWDMRDSATMTLTLTALAIGMSMLWSIHPATTIVLVPPVYMVRAGYQGYARLRREAESVLATLADLLDLRDHNTGQHSSRVAEMGWAVARHLGLSEEQALAVKAIARVHDVGKIVIRDAVLLKPGPLSEEEAFEMQSHVDAGAQILSKLSVYQPHLPILLQHHERLDGGGYPAAISAPEIELGARILAVCDAYDTMVSERPYHRAIPEEVAMAELHRVGGSQFDPQVVRALETWLIRNDRLRADWRSMIGTTMARLETLPEGSSNGHALNGHGSYNALGLGTVVGPPGFEPGTGAL